MEMHNLIPAQIINMDQSACYIDTPSKKFEI